MKRSKEKEAVERRGTKDVCMFWLCVCSPECSYGAEVMKNAALWAFGLSHILKGFFVPRCQVVDKVKSTEACVSSAKSEISS